MPLPVLLRVLCTLGLPIGLGGCGAFEVGPNEDETRFVDWYAVEWSGGTTNVAVLAPSDGSTGPRPVVFALPWGSGSANLVMSFLDSYWATEPGARGYYVVAPEVTGSTLADTADELIPAIFSWMGTELSYDPSKVALVGASNGGRGIFHAALSQPDRFGAMIGLPGQYSGPPGDLAYLTGIPVWLLVGEFDTGWVEASQATAAALEEAGVDVTLEILPNQEHVLFLSPVELMNWIDQALGL